MRRVRAAAQSLVEFALIAPVVILLAMAAWDGGSVLREQVVLQQAARDGARAAATAYGPSGAPIGVVQDAVRASAADLPGLPSTPGYLTVTYPDAQSVSVRLLYAHPLNTPVLRQLWGGSSGTVMLTASATFYLPPLTPTPASIVLSTPLPTATATPTATSTPTVTPTPKPTATAIATATATATPGVQVCARDITVPPLGNNTGYSVVIRLTVPSVIVAGWTTSEEAGGSLDLSVYAGNQPTGQPLVSTSGNGGSVAVVTPQTEPAGSYTVYFFKRGAPLTQTSDGAIGYQSGTCA